MRIAGLRLSNYGPFRGEFELNLEHGVYAVVARDAINPARSNWIGKSFALSSIPFALFGIVPTRTLDDAISYFETDMGVDLELTDGTFITRTKKRGQSMQLRVICKDGNGNERDLYQDMAQAEIRARIGMDLHDFHHTGWIAQKQMAAFLHNDPADRTRTVLQWIALEKVNVAISDLAKKLATIESELTAARARLEVHHGRMGDRESLQTELGVATGLLELARKQIAENEAATNARQHWESEKAKHENVLRQQQEIQRISEREPECPNAAMIDRGKRKFTDWESERQSVKDEVFRLLKLQGGSFDGHCPVMCAACPVADQVLAAKDPIDKALVDAKKLEWIKTKRTRRLSRWLDRKHEKSLVWNRWFEEQKRAHTVLEALPKPMEIVLGPEPPRPQPVDLEAAVQRQVAAKQALDRHMEAFDAGAKCAEDVDRLRGDADLHRTAIAILGAAKRRVTTRAIGAIESIANATLTRSGVDLGIKLAYGRELDVIADVCDCGRVFPRSAKVKTCEACGAIRGKKRDDKLHVELSSVSGAAEDLAGVAIQLAAARWLRGVRRSPWNVVALDEPFGALDRHHRSALAKTLAQIADDGFEQAFVIAHNDDVLDAMPRRLLITGDGKWAKIEVV